jgi:hypothetical protein
MKLSAVFIAVLSAILLLGCSSVSVTTDYDHEANFAALKTFEWMTVSKDVLSANASTNMFQNSLVDKRFRTAVKSELEAKGLSENSTNPDFLVMYHTGTQEKVNVTNYGYGYGRWGGYGYGGGGVDVQQYTQGTIILDFVDSKTKQLVWRGVATGALADKPDPKTVEERLTGIVQQLLANYPPGTGK